MSILRVAIMKALIERMVLGAKSKKKEKRSCK
jgi:hypothetical protein